MQLSHECNTQILSIIALQHHENIMHNYKISRNL